MEGIALFLLKVTGQELNPWWWWWPWWGWRMSSMAVGSKILLVHGYWGVFPLGRVRPECMELYLHDQYILLWRRDKIRVLNRV